MADDPLATPVAAPRSGDAVRIVVAYLKNPNTNLAPERVADLVREIYSAVDGPRPDPRPALQPAVPIDLSVTPDHLVCLEDGAKLKVLRRYLHTHFNLTPEEYRAKWSLPDNYPMVAPNYSRYRSGLAKDQGLGRREPKKVTRGRKA